MQPIFTFFSRQATLITVQSVFPLPNVIMLNVIMLNVIMLNVIMLNVVVPIIFKGVNIIVIFDRKILPNFF
jgi:hypothetical protein